MMTEDSMNTSGSGVPHVRKTSSTRASGDGNSGSISNGQSTTLTTDSMLLHVESGSAEASNTNGSGSSISGMKNISTSQGGTSLLNANTPAASHLAASASLMSSQPPLRSSMLYQNHPYNTITTSPSLDWYRLYDIRSMDIQSALDQMRTLLSSVIWNSTNTYGNNKSQQHTMMIYKLAYYRKQTKNHWYRDDPTFILLQIIMLLISCITYSIAFKISILHAISFMIISIFFNYLFLGVIITSILREFTNRHLLNHLQHHPSSSNSSSTTSTTTATATNTHIQKQQVEWLYAFDIHCNSFFPLFIVLYVVQFFSMPITLGEGFIPLIIANTLYAIGLCWYWYVTHLGYRALPFLSHTEIFLFPITIILFFYILMIVGYPFGLGYNMTRVMARFYFI